MFNLNECNRYVVCLRGVDLLKELVELYWCGFGMLSLCVKVLLLKL